MSGYWSAIAAAARGGAGGKGDAAPVPSAPLFAPEPGGDEGDWGAVDIEAAASMRSEPHTAALPPEGVASSAGGENRDVPVQTPAPVAAAILPPAATTPSDAGEDEPATAPLPARADPAEPVIAVAPAAVIPMPQVAEPLPIAVADAPGPPVAAAPAEASAVPRGEDETEVVDDRADDAPAIAEAAPVVTLVEAIPAATVAAADNSAFDGAGADRSADLPPPIHIHIDRIDIRLTEGDAGPARSARRRAAPVVALDDFLRRPAERKG